MFNEFMVNENLRIKQAVLRAKECGRPVRMVDLGSSLWPDAPEVSQKINISNLANGRTGRIKPEWVRVICEVCGCSADFLFGIEK